MKRVIASCIRAIAVVVLSLIMTSCQFDTEEHTRAAYKVTMYSGGEAVREWRGVSGYTRFCDDGVTLSVDGTYVSIIGDIVIEPE